MQRLAVLLFVMLAISSCIDRIDIKIPDSYSSQLVVDGAITDEPGPYTVRLTRATRIEKFLEFSREVVSQAKVTILDNVGNSELLTEITPGVYETKPSGIRGVVGREYKVKIETENGKLFESIPDKLNSVGEVDSLYYEFESYLPLNDQERYGFRFFVDAQAPLEKDVFLRWKFTRVFEIEAHPELHIVVPCAKFPRPCSGLIQNPNTGVFQRIAECTCCTCWVTKYEDKPNVSNDQFVSNGRFKRVEVGYVPLEFWSFQKGKYRVEVKQMSLSRNAFKYWNIVQSQKEGAASLFQPPTGKIETNIFSVDGEDQAQGLFYASSVKIRQFYLTRKDVNVLLRVPLWDCEEGLIAESCILAFKNSSNKPPHDWK
jgi:Domain of unknown function (DUF4249)